MLNEESTKYFQQILIMSGTANTYNMYVQGNHRCLMQIFAKKYGKWVGDSLEKLIELLKNVSEQEILNFSSEVRSQPHDKLKFQLIPTLNNVWLPMVEGMHYILLSKIKYLRF